VHNLWSSQIEVVHLDEKHGGFLNASFHQRLAEEAVRGWAEFRDMTLPKLPRNHPLVEMSSQSHAAALNDGFFHYQKNLFEQAGNLKDALNPRKVQRGALPGVGTPGINSSWPRMDAMPEYNLFRKIVDRFSRRYLMRAGLHPTEAQKLEYSIFNWCAINGPGEFHGPHTHVGEYMVGVFYAQVGSGAGKIRFGDPRGLTPPFGNHITITPKSGDLIFFPSWFKHMATVTAPETDPTRTHAAADEPNRVLFAFNIGPVYGPMPCFQWFSDPTGDMSFSRKCPIDPATL
jgi:hypothetical protein